MALPMILTVTNFFRKKDYAKVTSCSVITFTSLITSHGHDIIIGLSFFVKKVVMTN